MLKRVENYITLFLPPRAMSKKTTGLGFGFGLVALSWVWSLLSVMIAGKWKSGKWIARLDAEYVDI